MDIDGVERLGALLLRHAAQLRELADEIGRSVGSTSWNGSDAQTFLGQWWPEHRARLLAMAERLHGYGQSALNNAGEQRQASLSSNSAAVGAGIAGLAGATLPSGWAGMSSNERTRQLMRMGWQVGDQLWRQLSTSDRDALVGQLKGEGELAALPPEVRYAVNRALVRDEYLRLNELRSPSERELAQMDLYSQLLREDDRYRVLAFDPSGDGRLVVVQGDLAAAPNVVVQVPGISNGLHNFGGLLGDGARLYGAAGPGDTAVVTWLGYDTPDVDGGFSFLRSGVEITTTPLAEAGATQLRGFVSEVASGNGDARVSVVGHSYGSLVTGLAARQGLDADAVVLIGSPGAGVDSVGSLVHDGVRPEVYVGYVTDDAHPSLV